MRVDRHLQAERRIQKKFRLKRSPKWPEARRAYLGKNPKCAACGSTQSPNVHHKYPFHFVVLCGRPDLELDPRNYITLCTTKTNEHHVLLGHLDDYESYNPQVERSAKTFHGKDGAFIRGDRGFQKAKKEKPKHLEEMSKEDKANFRAFLNRKFKPNPAITALVREAGK